MSEKLLKMSTEARRSELLEKYFSLLARDDYYRSLTTSAREFYLDYLFKDTSFEGKSVLDIGGGSGAFSFYAAIMGAQSVVCLEPCGEGYAQENLKKFEQFTVSLTLRNVYLKPIRLQEFNRSNRKFDIILLHNSINHLDENACATIHSNADSKRSFEVIFKKLSKLAKQGSKLIIADCSRHNFFEILQVKNPFAPSIEWHKHQSPEFWSQMLSNYGFRNPKIRWTSFSGLRRIGEILLGNRFASFFLTSHFILGMDKLS